MATAAMFVALGGTSYAVVKLPKGAVGNRELKKNAVTSENVLDGTLSAADLAPGALLAGPRGPRGIEGPSGPKGDTGATGPAGPGGGPAEGWKELSYATGWSSYVYNGVWERGAYRKDQLGNVQLRGLVSFVGGTPSGGSRIATLPIGYRPSKGRVFVVQTGEGPPQSGRVDIHADGSINWSSGATGENDYTSLEGISFDVS